METINQFISLIQSDREDDSSFESSRFIDSQYDEDPDRCIKIIQSAFRMESYRYAGEVISAIRFSNIDYIQAWFKKLLVDGRHQPKLRDYIDALWELYREELGRLCIT